MEEMDPCVFDDLYNTPLTQDEQYFLNTHGMDTKQVYVMRSNFYYSTEFFETLEKKGHIKLRDKGVIIIAPLKLKILESLL